jgi:CBS domain-containing protein
LPTLRHASGREVAVATDEPLHMRAPRRISVTGRAVPHDKGVRRLLVAVGVSRGARYRVGHAASPLTAPGKGSEMNQLSEILDEKGTEVLRIDAGASVFEAVKRMVEANVGSLLVTEEGEITGIVTERDYLRRVALEGRTDKETAVREIMSSPLIVVTLQTTIDESMALMTDRRIRHLPVVDGGEVVGVVSIGDVVKFKSMQQSFEIKYLTDYITAR